MSNTWSLAWRMARRELRGGLSGFRVFLASLALGVAAIAGVGSVSTSVLSGLERDARVLLGADLDLSRTHVPVNADQRAWLSKLGTPSATTSMRAMARLDTGGPRTLVELKAVDGAYPLYGKLKLAPDISVQDGLAARDGVHGALIDGTLALRLKLAIGDRLRIGDLPLEIRAIIEHEPDRTLRFASFGPRVMISEAALAQTGLVRQGSLIHHHFRLALADGVDFQDVKQQITERYPNAGWRLRGLDKAAPGFERFVDRVTQFLSLVGLTALLVGGVGIANAVRGFMETRLATIAILKCLGVGQGLVFRVYLLQVMAMATVGIGGGLLIGALAPIPAGALIAAFMPFDVPVDVHLMPLLVAAALGYLTTLAFSLWPLGRAGAVRAAQLFRASVVPPSGPPPRAYLIAIALAVILLAALAIVATEDHKLAAGFVAGAAGALVLFGGMAWLLMKIVARLPRIRIPTLRLALANLHRPGAPTVSIMLSLGLGLSVLVAIALIRDNLERHIDEQMPYQAPSYFFIDIQPSQIDQVAQLVKDTPDVGDLQRTPMVRGRLVRIAGVPIDQVKVDADVQWVVNGDRGLTYTAGEPEGVKLIEGEWWPADYSGPPLISMDANAARGFGVTLGDTITFNILGREITATIGNLRRIDWASLGLNFVFVFAPGTLEAAPHSIIATVRATTPEAENAIQQSVTSAHANISAIRVKDALDNARRILDAVAIAVRSTAAFTLMAGVLVLAGAIMAGHRRRVFDAVVLKVLGATRIRVIGAYVIEYGLQGAFAAIVACGVGSLAAFIVVTRLMRADFVLDPAIVAGTGLLSVVLTVGLGLVGTWRALGERPGPLLRNE